MNNRALTIATVATIWFIVVLTLGAELSASFKTLVAQIGGHHWVGKSILSTVLFLVVFLLFKKTNESSSVLKNSYLVVGSVVFGGLIIFLFYLLDFLKG